MPAAIDHQRPRQLPSRALGVQQHQAIERSGVIENQDGRSRRRERIPSRREAVQLPCPTQDGSQPFTPVSFSVVGEHARFPFMQTAADTD
jgi:hypothetical protein